jgi:hypothetical protein
MLTLSFIPSHCAHHEYRYADCHGRKRDKYNHAYRFHHILRGPGEVFKARDAKCQA